MRFARSFARLAPLALAALVTLAAAPLAAQVRADSDLRDELTAGFRSAAAALGATVDLSSLGIGSTKAMLGAAVALPPAHGLDGAIHGEPFALTYLDGSGLSIAPGHYRVAINGSGKSVLLNSRGGAAATGTASLDFVADPGTRSCWADWPNPDDSSLVCWRCIFGHPGWPGGAWAVNTCFKIGLQFP